MCCVLVGQMQNALLEIRDKYRPDRIIIECSGSAFPATLAFQIRELERQTNGDLKLDAIVTVVDAENFVGYEDTSPTARMQASYTDIILINKWELVNERALDVVLDHLHTLNDLTPKIRCRGRSGVDPNLIFGIESKLFLEANEETSTDHNGEVETVSVYVGYVSEGHHHDHEHSHRRSTPVEDVEAPQSIDEEVLAAALAGLSKESVWRVKGLVRLTGKGMHVLNWAFGRFELTMLVNDTETGSLKLTVMGERGEVRRAIGKFCTALNARVE
ncbi:CobW/HypB/UreG, nucleotide-binding domain-containing protein [Mycena crocata]|nr:CobW/HypB/UreG, nucleotide-binding domain-containing protein [Mycena crocata]